MKTIIILFMSILTTSFYAQSPEDIELATRINNIAINNISHLAGNDYFIFAMDTRFKTVISKINNTYTYYLLDMYGTGGNVEIKTSKIINSNPILDKIFTNFVPKPNVKRYVSDYGYNVFKTYILFTTYFAIYINGVKTFDTCLPGKLDGNVIESPIDDETLDFLYDNVLVNPDKL
ncbi:hypothetical protein [Flavobacterium sp. FlaQc-48]|uniref:hypothetical protein n=1 Tax=Flavobacterium sp. FlaQc-48 TaxID=3374181 RepID=UPI0037567F61